MLILQELFTDWLLLAHTGRPYSLKKVSFSAPKVLHLLRCYSYADNPALL